MNDVSQIRLNAQPRRDPPRVHCYPAWEGLIAKYAVQGKRSHDVSLVALMIQYRVFQVLTFNDADFRHLTEIEPHQAFAVLAIPRT